MSESFGLLATSSTTPPTNISRLRSAIDTEEPMTVCNRVVSVVTRD